MKTQPQASSTPKPKTWKAQQVQREYWKLAKRKERAGWSSQKLRSNWERSLKVYHDKKKGEAIV